jgi:hypothetical protein
MLASRSARVADPRARQRPERPRWVISGRAEVGPTAAGSSEEEAQWACGPFSGVAAESRRGRHLTVPAHRCPGEGRLARQRGLEDRDELHGHRKAARALVALRSTPVDGNDWPRHRGRKLAAPDHLVLGLRHRPGAPLERRPYGGAQHGVVGKPPPATQLSMAARPLGTS